MAERIFNIVNKWPIFRIHKPASMKKNIARLRIVGILAFALYLISNFFQLPFPVNYKPGQVQQALMFVALACFAIVIALQLYRYYISTYSTEENDGE